MSVEEINYRQWNKNKNKKWKAKVNQMPSFLLTSFDEGKCVSNWMLK